MLRKCCLRLADVPYANAGGEEKAKMDFLREARMLLLALVQPPAFIFVHENSEPFQKLHEASPFILMPCSKTCAFCMSTSNCQDLKADT